MNRIAAPKPALLFIIAGMPDYLTPRELEILALMAIGKVSKEMASELNISGRTVDTHRANIFRKIGAHNAVEAVIYGVRSGILSCPCPSCDSFSATKSVEYSRLLKSP